MALAQPFLGSPAHPLKGTREGDVNGCADVTGKTKMRFIVDEGSLMH